MIEQNKLIQILKEFGFGDKEAKIYLILLELKEALPSTISRKTGLKRPTTYLILENLQKHGLVSNVKKGNLLYFRATDPSFFLEKEEKHIESLKDHLTTLKSSLPEIMAMHREYANTPQMSVYRGTDGLIQIMEDTLTTKTELLCWCDVELAVNSLKDYYPTYIQKKIAKKIWLRGIFCDNENGRNFKKIGKKELRKVHLIPKVKYPLENEINIYDDKLAIISHKEQIGFIIQNIDIANTQRAIFNLAFTLTD